MGKEECHMYNNIIYIHVYINHQRREKYELHSWEQ